MPSFGGTSRTVSTQELAPEQRQLLEFVMPLAENYASQPLELFPGSTIAPTNPIQDQARADILNTAGGSVSDLADRTIQTASNLQELGTVGGLGGAGQLLGAGQMGNQSLGSILSGYATTNPSREFLASGALLNPATNPVLGAQTSAAIRPLVDTLQERVLPQIRGEFVGNNMFGSSRQGLAEGLATEEVIRQASDIATNLQANNFNQGLGAMLGVVNNATDALTSGIGAGLSAGASGTGQLLNAVLQSMGQSPSLGQFAFLPGMTAEGIGSIIRQDEQARLSELADRFTTEQMLPILQAQDIANLAFGIGGGSATTTAQQNPAFDPISTGIGLLMLPSLLSGLPFSDRRLKENIKRLGTVEGVNVYSFNFKGSKHTQVGVMADEVPWAVSGQFKGYEIVNYERIAR